MCNCTLGNILSCSPMDIAIPIILIFFGIFMSLGVAISIFAHPDTLE